MFGSVRRQDNRTEIIAQVLDEDGKGKAIVDLQGYEINVARLLWKAGLQWQASPALRLGLTFTTPGVNLFGDSRLGSTLGAYGFEQDDVLSAASKSQDDVQFKSPLSVGLGGAYSFKRSTLHLSAEWFDSVAPYHIAAVAPSGVGADTLGLSVTNAAKAVFNWGLGFEHRFTDKVKGFASVVSDNSAAPDTMAAGQNAGTAPWDINIASLGADIDLGAFSFTLGGGFGGGDAEFDEVVDFIDIDDGGHPDGYTGEAALPVLAIHLRVQVLMACSPSSHLT